ncbi:hypothetical protein ACWEP4_43005 [Streptomyces sp. NPDC004227]
MDATADLKLLGVAYVDGQPLACDACDNTFSLEVHKRSMFETAPAWISCLACGHGHESADVTTGLADAVLTARTDRQADADRDAFTVEWEGAVLEGELVPLLDTHQILGAAEVAYEGAAPEVKAWWGAKKRTAKAKAKAPWRAAKSRAAQAVGAARGKAGEGAAAAKAGALTAAWTLQTGGAGPATSTKKRRRCTVKGCRSGWLTIRTRIHSTTGKAEETKVECAVCRRAANSQ